MHLTQDCSSDTLSYPGKNICFNRLQLSSRLAIVRNTGAESGGVQAEPFTNDLRFHPAYRPDIDGLRAVAIIPVVLYHAFPALLPGGFVGVDIFFVISGFLISSIIFKGLQRDSFSFIGFYSNRIKRIFPALILVLSACFVFGWFFLLPGEYAELGKHIAGGVAYVENLVLRREAGYFDTKSFLKPLMHLWSLGIEEQFYLTYPLLLWIFWRLRRNLLTVIVSVALVSFSLNIWLVHKDAVATFFLPQTRFWELLAGGALAYLRIFPQPIRSRSGANRLSLVSYLTRPDHDRASVVDEVVSALGLVLVGVAIFRIHESDAFPGWWAVLPVCGAFLSILAGPSAWLNRRILSSKPAVFIGQISYPLYLWHWPLLSFPRIMRGDELSLVVKVSAVLLSVVFSWATWRFIESPIRFGRKLWIKPVALTVASAMIGFIGYTAYRQEGLARRFKSLPEDLGRTLAEPWSTPECRKTIGSDEMEYCRSTGTDIPEVLLIGDSHAASLYHGIAQAYRERAQSVMNLGAPGCVPFYDTESYSLGVRPEINCKLLMNRMLAFATSSPRIRTIILSLRGPENMSGQGYGATEAGEPRKEISWDGAPKDLDQSDMFAATLRNTLRRLSAAGKDVVIFIDWPELGFDPKSCLPRPVNLFSSPRPRCGVPRSQVDERNRAYRDVIGEMEKEFSRLRVFDPIPYLCDSSVCYAMTGGHLLYRDDNHLSAAGAIYLGERFVAERSVPGP